MTKQEQMQEDRRVLRELREDFGNYINNAYVKIQQQQKEIERLKQRYEDRRRIDYYSSESLLAGIKIYAQRAKEQENKAKIYYSALIRIIQKLKDLKSARQQALRTLKRGKKRRCTNRGI